MSVAVIDVGSNTVRLLVAEVEGRSVTRLRRERSYLRLGDDVHLFGSISPAKLADAGEIAGRFARLARRAAAERLETIVTAPGRQAANGRDLLEILEARTGAPVVQLSGDDEGRLAWEGAVAGMDAPPRSIAVVDLGGGSCELAVGSTDGGATWVRSLDTGALRVLRTYLGGASPPHDRVLQARRRLQGLVHTLEAPEADATVAVGGTARAIARVIGSPFDADRIEGLAETLERVPPGAISSSHAISRERAASLLGGTLILLELAHRLGAELHVGRTGLREGAALALARRPALVAA